MDNIEESSIKEAIEVLSSFDKQVKAKADGAYETAKFVKAKKLAIFALEKQMPKKIIYPHKNYSNLPVAECPVCGCRRISYAECFCARCGQRLDWND